MELEVKSCHSVAVSVFQFSTLTKRHNYTEIRDIYDGIKSHASFGVGVGVGDRGSRSRISRREGNATTAFVPFCQSQCGAVFDPLKVSDPVF